MKKEGSGCPETPFSTLAWILKLYHILCLEPFGPLGDIKLDGIALVEGLEASRLNGGMVYENILSGRTANKAEAFVIVKPLYSSLFSHFMTFLFSSPLQ